MFSQISLGIAFLAGMASFLSPCVFSLVPAYIGYLGGRSATSGQMNQKEKWLTFTHGLAFVLGFSLVFIILGIAASALGGLLYTIRSWLAKFGGVVVVIFGLNLTGLIHIKYLEYDFRPRSLPDKKRGYLASLLMGIFFSAGWSPCVGPVLGTILTFALNEGSISNGALLLSVYSMGLAIPFLITAFGIGWVITVLQRYKKLIHFVEIITGVVLIAMGIMLFFGIFEQLARFGYFIDFGL